MSRVGRYHSLVLALALALTVSAAMAAGVVAQSEAEDYERLVNEIPASGMLTGNRAGSFAYYTIKYPGDLRVVTIELEFAPADPVTRLGVGVNVYGPGGYVIGQTGAEDTSSEDEVLTIRYSDDNRATWLVQVYNYIPNHTVSYSVTARGLPEETPTEPPTTSPPSVEPQPPASLDTTMTGSLTGQPAGAFNFYEFSYAGDGSEVEVQMRYVPDNDLIAKGVGFVIYGPAGEVARGTGTGRPTERTAVFSSDVAGTYLIQVYNYISGLSIQYAIELSTT
jgi:hypothetical protein